MRGFAASQNLETAHYISCSRLCGSSPHASQGLKLPVQLFPPMRGFAVHSGWFGGARPLFPHKWGFADCQNGGYGRDSIIPVQAGLPIKYPKQSWAEECSCVNKVVGYKK